MSISTQSPVQARVTTMDEAFGVRIGYPDGFDLMYRVGSQQQAETEVRRLREAGYANAMRAAKMSPFGGQ